MRYLLYLSFFFAAFSFGQCPNGDAESNNFSNWTTLYANSQNPQYLNQFTVESPTTEPDRFGILNSSSSNYPLFGSQITNGVDNYSGIQVPSQGVYCFALNSQELGGAARMMKYTFTVTEQNKLFKLRYALVLEDGGHGSGENPEALLYMNPGSQPGITLQSLPLFFSTKQLLIADLSDPYFKRSPTSNSVIYRDWQCVEYDLSRYVGQQVSFIAMARGCVPKAHFGYMYIDGLCDAWPATADGELNGSTFCLEQPIILNGSASEGEDRYYVEIAEVDAYDNVIPTNQGGLLVSEWFLAQQAPSDFNVSNWLAQKGITLQCGKRYKVKLAVSNYCSPWNEDDMYLNIVCPHVTVSPDKTICCGESIQGDPTAIGGPAVPGNTYSWTSFPAGFTSTSANPSVNPTTTTSYFVTMTQPNGCIARDTVTVRYLPPGYTMSLTSAYKLCDYQPYVTAHLLYDGCYISQEYLNALGYPESDYISWTFIPTSGSSQSLGTGMTIHAPNADGTLVATISTPCAPNVSASIQINYRPGGHEVIYPNSFTPNGDGVNDIFRILEYGPYAPPNIGDEPAYGISDFELIIFNRWGNIVKIVHKADVGRGPNDNVRQGDISWDGTDSNGHLCEGPVAYAYKLNVKLCGSDVYTPVQLGEMNLCVQRILGICVRRLSGWAALVDLIR